MQGHVRNSSFRRTKPHVILIGHRQYPKTPSLRIALERLIFEQKEMPARRGTIRPEEGPVIRGALAEIARYLGKTGKPARPVEDYFLDAMKTVRENRGRHRRKGVGHGRDAAIGLAPLHG